MFLIFKVLDLLWKKALGTFIRFYFLFFLNKVAVACRESILKRTLRWALEIS